MRAGGQFSPSPSYLPTDSVRSSQLSSLGAQVEQKSRSKFLPRIIHFLFFLFVRIHFKWLLCNFAGGYFQGLYEKLPGYQGTGSFTLKEHGWVGLRRCSVLTVTHPFFAQIVLMKEEETHCNICYNSLAIMLESLQEA